VTGAFGTDRLARRMLSQAEALRVPVLADPDVRPISRVELARRAGITPDDWQRRVLESESRKILMCCCRQSGKSTTAAVLAVHEAVTRPGALALMLAPSLRQSGELFRSCLQLMKRAETPEGPPLPAITAESALRCELENEARIIALPGSEATTRGYSAATLVVIDEAARVPDALIAAVRPALATTNGRIVALSTPAGKRGWYFLEWATGVGWERSQIVARECPRISTEFLEDEQRSLGPHVFEQEYNCEFFDPDTAVFSSELIERAMTDDILPLWNAA